MKMPRLSSLALPLCLSLAWTPSTRGASGVVPAIATTTKTNKKSPSLAEKMFKDMDFPPIELDLQVDFDVTFIPTKGLPKKVPKKVVKPPPPKKKVTPKALPKPPPPPVKKVAPPPKVVVKKVAPPPPPKVAVAKKAPEPKVVVVKKVAPPKKNVVPRKPLSAHVGDVKKRLSNASDRVAEHKYAKVVWATLLFVWTPLLLIALANQVMGKEFLIDILARTPLSAHYIEMAIEDGVWVAIFGACVAATVGTLLVETTALAMDVLTKGSPKKKKKNKKL